MNRKGITIRLILFSNELAVLFKNINKKKLIVCLSVIIIALNLTLTNAEETSEETHDIALYIFGEGGGAQTYPHFSGYLTTKAPDKTTDEYQIFHPKYPPSSEELYYWYSDPLHLNISIIGDVHFTIWAICNQPRNLSFTLSLNVRKPDGSSGFGRVTEDKMVYNQPVEFNAVITQDDIEENDLKYFNKGDCIGIGIQAFYQRPQLPAEVKVLYNSTSHPSHMTINTSSVSIDISNPKTSHESTSIDAVITDAFGIYDIVDYDVQITDPSENNMVNFELFETKSVEEGCINLEIMWKISEGGNGNYIINITVIDNNDNCWTREEVFKLNFKDDENGLTFSLNLLVLLSVGIFIVIIILLIMVFSILKRRRKLQPPQQI